MEKDLGNGRAVVNEAPDGSSPQAASIPIAGAIYTGGDTQMYIDYLLDAHGDPTVEKWFFANCEDDPNDGHGWLEVKVREILETRTCGTIAVYYKQWFAPDGEPLARARRQVGSLSSLKALIRRRKLVAKAIEAGTAKTERKERDQ